MKKLFIIFSFGLFIFQSNAQIKVTSNGSVGIGTSSPSTANKVTIEGDNILIRAHNLDYSGLQIKYDSEYMDISPADDNQLVNTIGYNRGFDEIYSNTIVGNYGQFYEIYCTGHFYNWSDTRLKKNINSLSFDKSVFSKIHPVSYEISDSLLLAKKQNKKPGIARTTFQYGFLAQELQSLYPQLVTMDEKTGFLKVKPLELLPIMVSAIQDLQAKTDAQAKQIDYLMSIVAPTNSSPKKVDAIITTGVNETNTLTYPVLDQNTPNPFNQSTTIGYYLPTTINNAAIYVYDMNGVQLKSYNITERGKKNIIINGSEFNAGMYLYALIADGKVIDTKRMILTK